MLFSLKTPAGYAPFGEFELTANHHLADALFDSLEGDTELSENCHFHIDLIETVEALPEKISSKCSKLDELAENMKLIACEAFRQKNLEEGL